MNELTAQTDVSLRRFTTLRTGGCAAQLAVVHDLEALAAWAVRCQSETKPMICLGWGSNVLPSDTGVPGLVLINRARAIRADRDGAVLADAGCGFQELFLKTAQMSLGGLEFAVGIPGTLGGALVSNAGAYRSCISEFVTAIEIVEHGVRRWVEPSYLEFSYRDSILRRPNPPAICLLQVKLQLASRRPKDIYDEAREYQRQRISKQPPQASAGSFFKNVNDRELAQRLESLPEALRSAGVVPSGYLIEAVGMKGFSYAGARLGPRHANIIVNVGNARASAIRSLAAAVRNRVRDRFGVELEEEVLYLGDWSSWTPDPVNVS